MAKGIYKRGNIFWIRYAGLDGRIIRESSDSDKFKVAEALYLSRKQGIKDGKQPEIKKIANHTFNELADKYSEWMNGRHRSADNKEYRISGGKKPSANSKAKNMREVFGNLPLRHFSTLTVEQYQTDLINCGLKPASVNKDMGILKAMFRKAVDWNMVEEEIHKRVGKVKMLPENNKRLRYLSKEECQALLTSCEEHLRPIVLTALNTGMRRGEILGLQWEKHIDLRHGFVTLDKTKNDEGRTIPINDTLRGTLQRITRRLDVPYVFFDQTTGKRYKEVKRSFKTALKRAGIRDFHFHDCRHTFASQLVMAGVDLTTVSKLLGHKTLAMTLRYAHLAPAHMVKAVDILDGAMNGNSRGTRDCAVSVS